MNRSRPPGRLKQRAITALLLLPVVVGALVYLPSAWLGVAVGVFVLVAAREWAMLSGLTRVGEQTAYLMVLALIGVVGLWVVHDIPAAAAVVAALGVIWWICALVGLLAASDSYGGIFRFLPVRLVAGVLALVPAWLTTIYLHATDPKSPAGVLFVFALVWIADSSAYFVGKAWGRTKLAPNVSPGKTVEGLLGAVAAVVVLAYICGTMIWHLQGSILFMWIAVAVTALFFSVVGDLVESKLKRVAGVKDSGTWLPGHGGALDRIDALTAAVPAFVFAWVLLLDIQA
ncbi:MAG: phosphatidate cytidylyltransferase [Acidiferrobacterales bacterium]